MKSKRNQNDNKAESQILVFSACALESEVEWVDGCCNIDNSILTSRLSKFASNIKKYIDTLKLRSPSVIDSFSRDGSAWVNVFLSMPNLDIDGVENNLSAIQNLIQESMSDHRLVIEKLSSQTSLSEQIKCGGNAAVEAFSKFAVSSLKCNA